MVTSAEAAEPHSGLALQARPDAAARRAVVAARLHDVVQRGELSLLYQPQVDLRSGAMYGVEALLRWHSPELGSVSPTEFIEVAEQTGQIVPIGDWVLRTACAQAAAWRRAGLGHLRVSVNVSPVQFAQGDLAQQVQSALLGADAEPGMLGVEITESMLVADVAKAARALHALRAIGVQISLDDFGTGYSNLSVLCTLPIDVIKIDRSYVHDVTAAPAQVSITRAVITMAHSLQMKVLAEGVETEGQMALLVANRCDAMQGFYASPPVRAAEIEARWREPSRLPAKYFSSVPRQRTLLLVDDEEGIIAALRRLLRRGGYQIVTANSGAEGLQRLAESEVDVIVSDQRMPGMAGVDFLRRAKQLYPDTIRIVLSGYTELQSITEAINEGAIYKFLTKPWEDDLLRANIEEAFRQKEMADENRRLNREVRTANQELAAVNLRLQETLDAEHERLSLSERRSTSALEVLRCIPVPLIGVDEDGMIAFVNHDAEALLVDCGPLLGRDADQALPESLLPMLQLPNGETADLALGALLCRCSSRTVDAGSGSQCRLIIMVPRGECVSPA